MPPKIHTPQNVICFRHIGAGARISVLPSVKLTKISRLEKAGGLVTGSDIDARSALPDPVFTQCPLANLPQFYLYTWMFTHTHTHSHTHSHTHTHTRCTKQILHLVSSKNIFICFCYISLPLPKICYQRGTETHTLHHIKSFCNDIGGWDQV